MVSDCDLHHFGIRGAEDVAGMLYQVPLTGLLKISLKALVVKFQLKVFIKVNFEVLHLIDVTIVTNAQCTQPSI